MEHQAKRTSNLLVKQKLVCIKTKRKNGFSQQTNHVSANLQAL